MTNEHPLTPPLEMMQQWQHDWFEERENVDVLLIQAFQAGADQELEAIEKEILDQAWFANPEHRLAQLRAARRPKPPSLKEQALAALERNARRASSMTDECAAEADIIRRALESLPDD
jgi:hypothetical protein